MVVSPMEAAMIMVESEKVMAAAKMMAVATVATMTVVLLMYDVDGGTGDK